ncbi:TPA: hypothetical protein ACITN2_004365, partial [Salmonella enterica subsp. enterica serovar Virchow]
TKIIISAGDNFEFRGFDKELPAVGGRTTSPQAADKTNGRKRPISTVRRCTANTGGRTCSRPTTPAPLQATG